MRSLITKSIFSNRTKHAGVALLATLFLTAGASQLPGQDLSRHAAAASKLPSSATRAVNASATYSPSGQSVVLTASVTSDSAPVADGKVIFTVTGIGWVEGSVSGGQATAAFKIPAGTQAGKYAISASYSGNSSAEWSLGGAALTIAKTDQSVRWNTLANTALR